MLRHVVVIAIATAIAVVTGGRYAASQPDTEAVRRWTDTVAGEYEIRANITYATANNTALKLDLYLPRKRTGPLPTVILIHGGGWVAGQKEQNVLQLLPYLALGAAVVNVEYRLADNSPAPAAVEDCLCALRWVGDHAGEFGFDTSRIVTTGGSAGGHLALMTGMVPPESPLYRRCPTDGATRWRSGTEPRVRVAAIVNWYGICDVADLLEGPNAKHYAIEWFGSMDNPGELAKRLSPLTYARAGAPPTITIHGDKDDIVPYAHASRLHAALDKAGVPNRLLTIPGAGHGGFSAQVLMESFSAIREFLRAQGVLAKE